MKGNPKKGLLLAILELVRDNPEGVFNTNGVTDELNRWHPLYENKPTTYNSVNSYFSQTPEYFSCCGPGDYCLRKPHPDLPNPVMSE
jgi:hypothetical protein